MYPRFWQENWGGGGLGRKGGERARDQKAHFETGKLMIQKPLAQSYRPSCWQIYPALSPVGVKKSDFLQCSWCSHMATQTSKKVQISNFRSRSTPFYYQKYDRSHLSEWSRLPDKAQSTAWDSKVDLEIWGKWSCIWLLILTLATKQPGIGFANAGDPGVKAQQKHGDWSFDGVNRLNFAVFSRLRIGSQKHSCYLVNDNREKSFEGGVSFVVLVFNLQQMLLLFQFFCLFSVNKEIKLITW